MKTRETLWREKGRRKEEEGRRGGGRREDGGGGGRRREEEGRGGGGIVRVNLSNTQGHVCGNVTVKPVVWELKQLFGVEGRTPRLLTTELPGPGLSSPDAGGLEGGVGIGILISTVA